MGFGERIRMIRGALRQDAFAEKVGLHQNTIGRWEREQRTPDLEDLNKILATYPDISPAWLLTGEGEMKRGYIEITKEDPKGFGRAKELTYQVYPGLGSRLRQRLGATTIEGLAEASKLPLDTVNGLLADKIPTVDELIAVAEALNIPIVWLAEGDKKTRGDVETKDMWEGDLSFSKQLQQAVAQAIIEHASPGIDELTAMTNASLFIEVMNVLEKGREAVPPAPYIKRIIKLFAALYDFWDSEDTDTPRARIDFDRALKLMDKIASKGKAQVESIEEERLSILEMVDKMREEEGDKGRNEEGD